MKKIISQVTLIMLIVIIGMSSVFITKVNAVASIAGLNVSSAKEGENFTVKLILPSNAAGVEATITVTYSNGASESQKLIYINHEMMKRDEPVSFKAKASGQATIKATGILIYDQDLGLLEQGGEKEQVINIESSTPAPTPNPTPNPNENSGNQNNNGNTNTTGNNTTKQPEVKNPTFKDVDETVYVVSDCNVRSSCSTDKNVNNKIGGLKAGKSVKRTGVEGTWSRIVFNGKTAYVATRLLTTEEPEKPDTNTVNNTSVKNTTVANNTVVNNTVTNEVTDSNVISKEEMLNQIEQSVGVLPEVGNNIAVVMFSVISITSITVIMGLYYKNKKDEIK